jgi:hypothetical protein
VADYCLQPRGAPQSACKFTSCGPAPIASLDAAFETVKQQHIAAFAFTADPFFDTRRVKLVANPKTAKTLGLEVAPGLLAIADEVIE